MYIGILVECLLATCSAYHRSNSALFFALIVGLRSFVVFVLQGIGKKPLHNLVSPKVAGKLAREKGKKQRESLKMRSSDFSERILVPMVI